MQDFIAKQGRRANCEICGSLGQPCLPACELTSHFQVFLSYYRCNPSLSPVGSMLQSDDHSLATVLHSDGIYVFSERVALTKQNALLNAVLKDPNRAATDWWYSAVIGQFVLSPPEWTMFVVEVKYKNRYNINWEKWDLPALLKTISPRFVENPPAGTVFFRARLHEGRVYEIPDIEFLGPPPPDLARGGRANASGIQVLYLSNSAQTAVAETRPFVGAVVSVAECRPGRDLRILDLTRESKLTGLDPFADDFAREMQTAVLIAELNREFAEPILPNTADRDYAPTQFVAEIIRANDYDGIKYRSAMNTKGNNYVIFYPLLFTITYKFSVRIKGVEVQSEQYDPEWLEKAMNSLLKKPTQP